MEARPLPIFATKQPPIIATTRKQHANTPNSRFPHNNSPLLLGFILAAGASTALKSSLTQKYYPLPTNNNHTSRILNIAKPVDYSSMSTFPSCDIGTLGGLVPNNWGLPYHGKNPSVALVMASAAVTLRMFINLSIIYLIKKYWLDN